MLAVSVVFVAHARLSGSPASCMWEFASLGTVGDDGSHVLHGAAGSLSSPTGYKPYELVAVI